MLRSFIFICLGLAASAATPSQASVHVHIHPGHLQDDSGLSTSEGRRRRRAFNAVALQGALRRPVAEDEAMLQAAADATRRQLAIGWILVAVLVLVVMIATYLLTAWQAKGKSQQSGAEADAAAEQAAHQDSASSGSKQGHEAEGVRSTDFECLFKTLTHSVAQKFGPKLAKGQAVRSIVESRLSEFPGKAKAFLMNELNGTAGAVMRAAEAEEAMMLLDLDNTITSSFPPISVLLAGLVSPALLSFSYRALILQLLAFILPVLAMCGWALWKDHGTTCSIPSMYLWVKVQFSMALFLGVANGMVAVKIMRGKRDLDAKTQRMQHRIEVAKQKSKEGGMGVNELRELFVCNSLLVEEALLLEDEVKSSLWFNALGLGTVLWLLSTVWTFVLVIGWTFVPGVTAFSPSASESSSYCGAWASVLTARISCILAVLFLIVNLLTVANWLSTVLMSSQSFSSTLLEQARAFDKQGLGFPVAELLVKALLLRGRSETMGAQLSSALADKAELEQDRDELRQQLADIESQIAERAVQVEAIKARAADAEAHGVAHPLGFETNIHQLESADLEAMGQEWKELGKKATQEAEARAAVVTQATTQELERLLQVFTDCGQQMQESEAYQSMAAKAQAAAEAGLESAAKVTAQVTSQATAAADQIQSSESVRSLLGNRAA